MKINGEPIQEIVDRVILSHQLKKPRMPDFRKDRRDDNDRPDSKRDLRPTGDDGRAHPAPQKEA